MRPTHAGQHSLHTPQTARGEHRRRARRRRRRRQRHCRWPRAHRKVARRSCRASSRASTTCSPEGGRANDDPRLPTMGWPPRTVVEPTLLEATATPSVSSATGRGARICKQVCRDALAVSKSGAATFAAGWERHSRHMLTCTRRAKTVRIRASGRQGGNREARHTRESCRAWPNCPWAASC